MEEAYSPGFNVKRLPASRLSGASVHQDAVLDRLSVFEVLQSGLTGAGAKDKQGRPLLVPPDEVPGDLFGAEKDGRVKYEVRYREIRKPMSGLINILKPSAWLDLLAYHLEERFRAIEQEQPGLDWRLVGIEVDETDTAKSTVQRAGALSMDTDSVMKQTGIGATTEWSGPPTPVGNAGPVTVDRTVQLVIRLVFACLEPHAELVDPNERHPDANPANRPPIAKYARERTLAQMPNALRDERKRAQAVMSSLAEAASAPRPKQGLDLVSDEEFLGMVGAMPPAKVAEVLRVPLDEVRARILTLAEPVAPAAPPAEKTEKGRK